jgi:PAS domain S-box-containing protein
MPFFLFTPAVLIAAFNGGIKPGLFAVALSALVGDFFFQAPIYSLTLHDSKALLTTFLFMLNSAMIAALGAGLHRAWRQAEVHASETMSYLDRVWQSEQRSRRLAETAFEGIWSLDAAGAATFVNARIAEMLGYPLSRVTSRPVLDFVFDEDREAMQSRLDALRGGGIDVFEFRFRKRDGSPLWCMVSVRSILDRDDVYLGCLLMVTDISERILEQAAAHNERRRVRQRIGQLSSSLQEILSDLRHAESASSTTSDDLRFSIEQLSHLADLSARTAEQLACDPARTPNPRRTSNSIPPTAVQALSDRARNEVATAVVSSPS